MSICQLLISGEGYSNATKAAIEKATRAILEAAKLNGDSFGPEEGILPEGRSSPESVSSETVGEQQPNIDDGTEETNEKERGSDGGFEGENDTGKYDGDSFVDEFEYGNGDNA